MQIATITSIDTNTKQLTCVAEHGFTTGHAVGCIIKPGSSMPASITASGVYYVRAVSTTVITLHATAAKATEGADALAVSAAMVGMQVARLSIKERLERNIMTTLSQVSGVVGVHRSGIDSLELPDKSIVLIPDDEATEQTTWPLVTMTLPLEVVVYLKPDGRATEPQMATTNRWIAAVEYALANNEKFGLPLNVVQMQVIGTTSQIVSGRNPELTCSVEIEVTYRHNVKDPYSET